MEGRGVRIERIADRKLREAVFRRRKNGLLRRAMELSVMADCDVAVLVFHGSSGALTQYSSSPIGGLLQRFARACGKPHETYTNEDLYSHHVLAQLAEDADKAAGASAKRARTLPSFWAAKAALEQQQRQPNGRHGGGGPEGEAAGSAARDAKRQRADEGPPAGGEQGRGVASPPLPDFSDLDCQAAALAALAEGEACPLTPRSTLAYQRISREFDRLVARAREEMETAEALAAVAREEEEEEEEEQQQGAGEQAGRAAEGAAAAGGNPEPASDSAAADGPVAGMPTTDLGQRLAAGGAGGGDVGMPEAAVSASAAQAPAAEQPCSPPQLPAASPGSLNAERSTPALSGLPPPDAQPDQQATPSTPARAGVPAAADAALAPSRPSTDGALPPLAAAPGPGSAQQQQQPQFQQQQLQQQQQSLQLPAGVVRGTALGPAPHATLPSGTPHLALPTGMQLPKGALAQLPAAARVQLGAVPRGGGYVLRPVAVPMGGGGAAAAGGGGGGQQQQPQGMMLQLQPVAMQPGQLQQYQRLLLQQQQQLVAMHAAATKAARIAPAAAAAQQQQLQQQQAVQTAQAGQSQQLPAGSDLVLPIVSQPHVQQQRPPQPTADAVADMLA